MKKKAIILSMIAGIFILGLRVWLAVGSREVPVVENAAVEDGVVSDGLNEWGRQETEEPEASGEVQLESERPEEAESEAAQAVQESMIQNKISLPEKVDFVEPIVKLNGEKGILSYDWYISWFDWYNGCIRVDADTFLFVIDCYFAEEKLQQKIFFLAEAPDFMLREVFRQDSKIWDEELERPECLEWRMRQPRLVEGGYVYELDGVLYFLDRDFKEASPLCDLRELMGDFYSFSPGTSDICDVTPDASRILVCTDEGLYEFDLESGERKLLEPAYLAPYEISEGDCSCGFDFSYSGPVRAEYGPDGQSYAFLTGTEEADWGEITGVVLRSGEGETLYQLKDTEYGTEYVNDFKWMELEDETYLAVFYHKDDVEKLNCLMDRVNINTKEVVTFEVPAGVYRGTDGCVAAGFLDADTLLYVNHSKPNSDKEGISDKNIFEVYRLSSGERQDLEVMGEADWEIMVLDVGGYAVYPLRYPK